MLRRAVGALTLMAAVTAHAGAPSPAARQARAGVQAPPAVRDFHRQLGSSLKATTLRQALISAIDTAIGHLDRPAANIDERLGHYRAALEAFFPAYNAALNDRNLPRARISGAVHDALAALGPQDPLRPLLASLAWMAKGEAAAQA